MTWFKVDDHLHDHRKARQAGTAAMGLWVLAGSWAAGHETDGFVPGDLIDRWATTTDADTLVEVGLWEPATKDGETGYTFHAWDEYQPTKAQLEARRQAARDRMNAARNGARSQAVRANSASTSHTVTSTPTRPVPTRPGGARADARPAPHCPRHPGGTDDPCRACADARRTADAWTPPPTPTPPTLAELVDEARCDDHGEIARLCPLCRRQTMQVIA